MTTKSITFAALIGFIGSFALAQTMVEDTDESGSYSMEELTAAYPDLTEEVFAQIDTDESGDVSADELIAAREAGLIAQ